MMTVLTYLRIYEAKARFNHLVKIGCTKKQAATLKRLLEVSEPIDLYNKKSAIFSYLLMERLI